MSGLFIPLGYFGGIPGTRTSLIYKPVFVPGAITVRCSGAVGNGAIDHNKKDLSLIKRDKSFLVIISTLIFFRFGNWLSISLDPLALRPWVAPGLPFSSLCPLLVKYITYILNKQIRSVYAFIN